MKTNHSQYRTIFRPDLGHMVRHDHYPEEKLIIDIFAYDWTFIVLNSLETSSIKLNGFELSDFIISNESVISIPPSQIARWQVKPGSVHWEAFTCNITPPENLPRHPSCFNWPQGTSPESYQQLEELIKNTWSYKDLSLKTNATVTQKKSAEVVKQFIDNNFFQEFRFQDLAGELGMSPATMYRNFNKSFLTSPSDYRNKLRVYNSTRSLLNGISATETCYINGFNDFSTFYRNFTKRLSHKPSDYFLKQ